MSRRQFFAVMVLGWVLLSSISFGYSGGDGTAGNPYQIASKADLLTLGATTADYGKNFVLTADIDLEGQTFTAAIISPQTTTNNTYDGRAFTGTFDGNGHKISNVIINNHNINYLGLFGYVGTGGQIKNLGSVNSIINGISSASYVGGIVGYNNYGSILNCYVSGTVNGKWQVGGLVGYNNYGNINACYVRGDISGAQYIGGLVGYSYVGNIINCYTIGTVVCTYQTAGGLVGRNTGCIRNCYSSVTTNGENYIGLVGEGGGVINSFWVNKINSNASSGGGKSRTSVIMKQATNYVGWNIPAQTIWVIDEGNDYPRLSWENQTGTPLPAQVFSDFIPGAGTTSDAYRISTPLQLNTIGLFPEQWNKTFRLENEVNLSGINGNEYNKIGVSQNFCFTGIFEGNGKVVYNFTYTNDGTEYYIGLFGYIGSGGQVKYLGLEKCFVKSRLFIGGLVGRNSGSINQCYSIGTVRGNSDSSQFVGGLAGINYYGSINNCYTTVSVTGGYQIGGLSGENVGNINNCYSVGTVSGGSEVGGLVGKLYDGIIKNCYSTCSYSGSSYVGGLVGYKYSGTVTNSNWITRAQMQTLLTFTSAGWDFTNETVNGTADIWRFRCEGLNYPKLNWQVIPAGDFGCPDGVSVEDLDYFVGRWLLNNCTADNNYCGGADSDVSGKVDLADYAVLAGHWLEGV